MLRKQYCPLKLSMLPEIIGAELSQKVHRFPRKNLQSSWSTRNQQKMEAQRFVHRWHRRTKHIPGTHKAELYEIQKMLTLLHFIEPA